ncbi:hypothetical protein LSAT2_012654 [Lamellibrachia satsuma]|nr:hypothetical protein LSAT2_012654 [Lamellibrachia satsuma]
MNTPNGPGGWITPATREITSKTLLASVIIRMKVYIFFVAVCIFALVMTETYAEEEDEPAVRETRAFKPPGPSICAVRCHYGSCYKICGTCAKCYCWVNIVARCKCC